MNKFVKFLIALFGGIEVAFSIFIPIGISLLVIKVFGFMGFYSVILLIAGMVASLFRAINVGFLR